MKQTPARVPDLTPFITALYLRPTIESVVEHNIAIGYMPVANQLLPLMPSIQAQMPQNVLS